MRISHSTVTECLGPGRRYVIWVQGCMKRCRGCINPEGWDTAGGIEKTTDELFSEICGYEDLTGVTISGGEPFLQAEELLKLIKKIKTDTNLDIMLYSGYSLEELKTAAGTAAEEIFRLTDIFIDGEYIEDLDKGSMYRGSDNQKIYFFTDKYKNYSDKILKSKQRNFSFEVLDSGEVYFIGIPPTDFYKKFLQTLGGN